MEVGLQAISAGLDSRLRGNDDIKFALGSFPQKCVCHPHQMPFARACIFKYNAHDNEHGVP